MVNWRRGGAQLDLAALFRVGGLQRIAHDVEQGLDQLAAVGGNLRQAGVVIADDLDPLTGLRADQVAHVLEQLVNVQGPRVQLLVGPQQPIDQVPQAVGLADDDAGVLAQLVVLQLLGQQLGCAAHSPERVLDLVGEAPDHLASGFLSVQQTLLATDP